MTFFIVRYILVWTVWIIFADKTRWRELFPAGIFAGFLGSTTDNITTHYKLWEYHGGEVPPWVLKVMDDWGIYIVVVYLFIQWLPKKRSLWIMVRYWFKWTTFAITVEYIHLFTGHMHHHLWWNLGYSYIADWVLFWFFYQFHKVFKLNKLSY